MSGKSAGVSPRLVVLVCLRAVPVKRMAQQFLEVVPSQIQFCDVLLGKVCPLQGRDAPGARQLHQSQCGTVVQAYSQLVAITNRCSTSIEASIRPSSSDRYSVHPKQLKLKGGQTCDVELRLKVTRFAQIEKAVQQGQRDAIHIKTPHFADQQFYVYFFLDPSQLANSGKGLPLHRNVPASVTSVYKDTSKADPAAAREFSQLDDPAAAGRMVR